MSNTQISECIDLLSFPSLKQLNLANNALSKFDLDLALLTTLVDLNLAGNSLFNVPPEIINQKYCLYDLTNFAKDLQHDGTAVYEAKLIIIGNGRVGKSSILKRLFLR